MRVHIATDHAGLELSHYLIESLTAEGYEMIDHGPADYDPLDDYPSFCINAALGVKRDREAGLDSLGIVLGGSGNGEQMAANKVEGIRALWRGTTTPRHWLASTTTHRSLLWVAASTARKKHWKSLRSSWLPPGPTRSVTHAVSASWLSTSRPATLPASRLTLPKL